MITIKTSAATSHAKNATHLSYRSAGLAAIASGTTGIAGVGFLIAYLVIRSNNMGEAMSMANIHDAVVMLQFILLIPVSFALQKLLQHRFRGLSNATLVTGIAAILFTIIFLLLGLVKMIAVVLYMFPQGIFGLWLIAVCWRAASVFSRGVRWFGIIVGFGLALVGSFPLQYAIFVSKIILQVPAASDEAVSKIPISHANMILHQVLWIGSPLGVLTLPFFTLLVGCKLLKIKTTKEPLSSETL